MATALQLYKAGMRQQFLFEKVEADQPELHEVVLSTRWCDDAPSKQEHVMSDLVGNYQLAYGKPPRWSHVEIVKHVDLWSCERYEVQ